MSPLEEQVESLRVRVKPLSRPAKVALFLTAAILLSQSWRRWAAMVGSRLGEAEFAETVAAVTAFIGAGGLPSAGDQLLARVESVTPSEPTDEPGFTAAQDCWICLDTALRTALGSYEASDATWYLLEPVLQVTSERLFGVTDVGSANQEEGETAILADAKVTAAIIGLERAIDKLSANADAEIDLRQVMVLMSPIAPE